MNIHTYENTNATCKKFRLLANVFCSQQFAFTLAEVLITLGVIGVVAAMTIPTVINLSQKQETVSKLQKAYTSLVQAGKLSEVDNGSSQNWDWGTSITVRQSFDTYWAPYLKILRYCTTAADSGYTLNKPWKNLDGSVFQLDVMDLTGRTPVILADGSFFMVRFVSGEGSPPSLWLDINAGKPPNVFGKDVFQFSMDANKGVMPYGYTYNSASVNANCQTGSTSGNMCSTKIIRDGWQIKDDYPWE